MSTENMLRNAGSAYNDSIFGRNALAEAGGIGALGGLTGYAMGPAIVSKFSGMAGEPIAENQVTGGQRAAITAFGAIVPALAAYMIRRAPGRVQSIDNQLSVLPGAGMPMPIQGLSLDEVQDLPNQQRRARTRYMQAQGYIPKLASLEEHSFTSGYVDKEATEGAGAGKASGFFSGAGDFGTWMVQKGVTVALAAPVVAGLLAGGTASRVMSPSDADLKTETQQVLAEDQDRMLELMKRRRAFEQRRKQLAANEQAAGGGRSLMLS